MPMVVFDCPITGAEVSTGMEADYATLNQLSANTLSFACPSCGEAHPWAELRPRLAGDTWIIRRDPD